MEAVTTPFDWSDFATRRVGMPAGRREIAVVLLGDLMRWSHGSGHHLDVVPEPRAWVLRSSDDPRLHGPAARLAFDAEAITVVEESGHSDHPLPWSELADAESSRAASLLLEARLDLASPVTTPVADPRALAFRVAAELMRQHPGRPGDVDPSAAVAGDASERFADVHLRIGAVTISTVGRAETTRGNHDLMPLYDSVGRNLNELVEVLTRHGHLFIAHSTLETVGATAVVIPTDAGFSVNPRWKSAAGVPADVEWDMLRPAGWGPGSVARIHPSSAPPAGRPDAWIVDSIAPTPEAVGQLAAHVVSTIIGQAGTALRAAARDNGLDLPLIALPMIGSGHGGHTDDRGRLADALVTHLSRAAATHGVDIVLVTASRSDHAVLQQLRRGRAEHSSSAALLGPDLLAKARTLGARIANKEVALFFGAGLSMGAGLPSWSGLLKQLLTDAGSDLTWDEVRALPVLDQGEVIERELRDLADRDGRTLGERVTAVVRGDRRPGLGHVLLAGMQIPNAVTTNYDQLYERAVEATGGVDDSREIAVLPWQRAEPDGPWILKMHGDIDHPSSIVLTRGAFVHYDSRWKPVGAVVQALMMTKHLVVVGASLTDDNLIRFAHEVALLRSQLSLDGGVHAEGADIGSVITLEPDRAFERLWSSQLDVVVAGSAPGLAITGRAASARALSLFLDAVAMYAAHDANHLLDARYQVGDSRLVTLLREAYAEAFRLGHDDEAWSALARSLATFGAAEDADGFSR